MSRYVRVNDNNYKLSVNSGGTITLDTTSNRVPGVYGSVIVKGNLTVEGITTTVSSIDVMIKDNKIIINDGEPGNGVTRDGGIAGLEIDRNTLNNAQLLFDENVEFYTPSDIAHITGAIGDGVHVTYTADNSYAIGMVVNVTGMTPSSFDVLDATITSVDSTTFQIASTVTDAFVSGGYVTSSEYVLKSGVFRFKDELDFPIGIQTNSIIAPSGYDLNLLGATSGTGIVTVKGYTGYNRRILNYNNWDKGPIEVGTDLDAMVTVGSMADYVSSRLKFSGVSSIIDYDTSVVVKDFASGVPYSNIKFTIDGLDVGYVASDGLHFDYIAGVTSNLNLGVVGSTVTVEGDLLTIGSVRNAASSMTLGDITVPTDVTANNGGIVLKGTTDKTFLWSGDAWNSSEDVVLAAGKVLTLNGSTSGVVSLSANGVASGVLTLPSATDVLVGRATVDTLTNKTIDSNDNSISLGGNAISSATGSGALVFSDTPTLSTPNLGVASATSINNLAITAPATGATLTVADGKTLVVSNSLTFTGTDLSTVDFGNGGTVLYSGADVTLNSSIVGNAGTEGSGILVNGTLYNSTFKVSDLGSADIAQTILHRHSTTYAPVMLAARSNSDTSSHAAVTAGMNLFNLISAGYTGINDYQMFGWMQFNASSTGTISSTSAPGNVVIGVTRDGTVTPTATLTLDQDLSAVFAGDVSANNLSIGSGKKLTVSNTLTFTGTDSSSVAFGTGGTVLYSGGALGTPSSGTLTNCTGLPISGISSLGTGVGTWLATPSSANLAAAITDETGTGSLVFANTPTLITPNIGVATATSINKLAITAPATGATLTVADGKTLVVSNSLTFTGTDLSSVAFGAGGTVLYSGGALGTPSSGTLTNCTGLPISGISSLGTGVGTWLATPSSANLAAAITDETGTGALVFGTSPSITTALNTGSTSFDLVNTTATTVNFAGAGTAISIGASTGTTTVNNNLVVTGNISTGSGTTTINNATHIVGNLVIDGNFNVGGTTTTIDTANVKLSDNMIYLNEAISVSITNASGDGVHVTYTAANQYAVGMVVTVTGMNPSSYNVTNATITSADSTTFQIASAVTDAFVSGGTAKAKAAVNPDLGFAGSYNDGTYRHGGLFRDATDGVWKFFKNYVPEPDAAVYIDTSDVSFALADLSIAGLTTSGHLTVEGVTSTGATGTGKFVFDGSPTLVTPNIGVASATSINKLAITAPATGATLTVADGKTLVVSNSLTFTGTDSSSVAFGTGGTVLYSGGALGTPSSGTLTNCTGLPISGISSLGTGVGTWLATPSSANLAAAITDETGTGALVFANTPTLVTPNLGVASATSINKLAITAPATSATLTVADGKTLVVSNSLTITATDGATINFGSGGTFLYSGGALGTPASGTLTNCTGLPVAGISGLGTGIGTWLATPSSANLASAITDETGSGSLVFATSPTLVTPTVTTSLVTGSTTFALVNTTATTVNFAGVATELNIAGGASAASTLTFGPAITGNTLKLAGTTTGTVNLTTDVTTGAIDVFPSVTGTITLGGTSISSGNGVVKLGVSPSVGANDGEVVTAAWVNNAISSVVSGAITSISTELTSLSASQVVDGGFDWSLYNGADYQVRVVQVGASGTRTQFGRIMVSTDVPVYTASGASSASTTVTVSSTVGLYVGMVVKVVSGTGTLPSNTIVTSVSSGSFVINNVPTVALSGASIKATISGKYVSAAGATNVGATITVGSTSGMYPGMLLSVTAGTGSFDVGTYVASITNSTTFVASQAPSIALSGGAVVTGSPNVYMTTYGMMESNGVIGLFDTSLSNTNVQLVMSPNDHSNFVVFDIGIVSKTIVTMTRQLMNT